MDKNRILKDISSGKVRDIRKKAQELIKEKEREKTWYLIKELKKEKDWRFRFLVGELLKEISNKKAFSKLKELVAGEEDRRANEAYQMALKSFLGKISKWEFLEEVRPKLEKWIKIGDEKVKRMISEGTRPRKSIRWLKSNPKLIIPILEKLREDKSHYVRESVANNLKDIGKAHPEFLVKIIKEWLDESDNLETKSIVIKGMEKIIENNYELVEPLLKELAEDPNKRISKMAKRRLK